jgi:four helix bundle protein
MRDHTKLRAFELADQLVLMVYRTTSSFPDYEQFGLSSQLRRAAVSTASNIVEGCARDSEGDYLRFLDMAYGSSREVAYQITIAARLKYGDPDSLSKLECQAVETAKVLGGLIRAIRKNR